MLILDELHREGLLACISQLVETQFAGSITRCNLYDLSVAQLPNQPLQRTGCGGSASGARS